jgi:uncharacterized protein DUF3768
LTASTQAAPGRIERVRLLNDLLRRYRLGGQVMVTPGVRALGLDVISAILTAVASFDAFDPDNDPYGEHDCAVLSVRGERVIWKVDHYDRSLSGHSPNPADPAVTTRVLTHHAGREELMAERGSSLFRRREVLTASVRRAQLTHMNKATTERPKCEIHYEYTS